MEKLDKFQEGDDYYVIDGKSVVWSCWDDQSEEMHNQYPNRAYYKTKEEAFKIMKELGFSIIKLYDYEANTGKEINLNKLI